MELLGLFIAIPVLFLIGLYLLLPIIAVIDIVRSEFRGNEAILMALIVVFIPFGAIIYFFVAPSRKIRR